MIVSFIDECARICNHKAHARTENLLNRIAIHRCSFERSSKQFYCQDEKLNAIELASRFAVTDQYAPGYYTKGTIPYTFLIKKDGSIEQCLPVGAVSNHALRWNIPAVGIAVIGDHRREKCGVEQWNRVVDLCALWKSYGLRVYGHDELPFAMGDRTKKCPGKYFPMWKFRNAVNLKSTRMTKEEAKEKLTAQGVIF